MRREKEKKIVMQCMIVQFLECSVSPFGGMSIEDQTRGLAIEGSMPDSDIQ
jgi:hypothetical protein